MELRFEEVTEMERPNVYDKLAEVHSAIRQPVKDSVNPHFNSHFASLNECLRVVFDAVRDIGGCDFWQEAAYNADAGTYEMRTMFSSGGETLLLSSFPFSADANPQKTASASTYARRYSIVGAFNLAAEDDDGNQASQRVSQKVRMWDAVKSYAEASGANPMEIVNGLKASPEWRDDEGYFESVADKYEAMANG